MANSSKDGLTSGTGWAAIGVTFVAVSLLVLAIVPVYLERSHHALEDRLGVLAELQDADASDSAQVPALQGLRGLHQQMNGLVFQYANTGLDFYRTEYASLLDEQAALYEELDALSDVLGMSPRWSEVQLRVFEWQTHHAGLMGQGTVGPDRPIGIEEVAPADFRPRLAEDERRFLTARNAVRDWEIDVTLQAGQVRSRLQFQEDLRVGLTVGSSVLAFVGLIVLLGLTRHFRTVARWELVRRHEAVEARRAVRSVLEATSDGVIGMDLKGRCTFVNSAGARLLGYGTRDLKGRTIHELIHHSRPDGSSLPAADCLVSEAIESGERGRSLDEILWRADGTSFPAQLAVSPMLDGLKVIGVVLTFTDLTEVRETEQALQEAVQARDEVLAVVSHDLRNPVGTIGAAAELLLEIPVTEHQRRDHLAIIRRSAERMGRLIQDLLDVARIEAGGFALELEPHDLMEVAREAVKEATGLARDREVRLDGPDFDRPSVWADVDRHRLLQALSNLVGNAIRHTPEGGSIRVEVERIGDDGWIGVVDTGPGIAPADLGRLFDRFWKGQRTERKGAGLGLAIVRGIAEAHGGEVTVDSEPGKGSRFSLRVPLRASPVPTPAGVPPDPS